MIGGRTGSPLKETLLPAVLPALLLLAACSGRVSEAGTHEPALDWWTTHAMEKVRPADPPGTAAPVELAAARNEFEPFQLVLRAPERPLRQVDVEVSDLAAEGGGESIAGRHAAVYLQRYLHLAKPSSIEGGSGDWPDPLLPRVDAYSGERRNTFPFDLGRSNQPLWIEIYVPPETAPGLYRGEVAVSVAGERRATVPVTLEVWPFTLPSTSSLRTSFGFNGVAALKQHRGGYTSDEDLYAITRVYAEAALRHRLSLHGGSLAPPPARFGRGGAAVEWADYDREVGPFLDGRVFTGEDPLPGARLTSIDLRTQAGLSDREKVLYWREWGRHFRGKGWDDRLFFYVWDEPRGPDDYRRVQRLGHLARQADPGIPVLLTEQLVPALSEVVDIWVTLVNCIDERPGVAADCEETVPRLSYERARRRGSRLWWYQSCASHGCYSVGGEAFTRWPSYVIDAPPMAHRIMPWLAWVYRIDGELYYNTVEAYGPEADPWTDVHLHGGNGDGTLFYPGTPERIGGSRHVPVESLRLKLIREGLEDYEYLALLARAAGAERARRWAQRIARKTYAWQRDPQALYRVREAMGRELARLEAAS